VTVLFLPVPYVRQVLINGRCGFVAPQGNLTAAKLPLTFDLMA
jgi:hypothetical protein